MPRRRACEASLGSVLPHPPPPLALAYALRRHVSTLAITLRPRRSSSDLRIHPSYSIRAQHPSRAPHSHRAAPIRGVPSKAARSRPALLELDRINMCDSPPVRGGVYRQLLLVNRGPRARRLPLAAHMRAYSVRGSTRVRPLQPTSHVRHTPEAAAVDEGRADRGSACSRWVLVGAAHAVLHQARALPSDRPVSPRAHPSP